MRFTRSVTVTTVVTILLAMTACRSSSSATLDHKAVAAAVSAVDGKNDTLVLVASKSSLVKAPQDPKSPATYAGENQFSVGLPNASKSGPGQDLTGQDLNGMTVYSGEHSANAVIPTEGGAQFLTVIGSKDAPAEYTYPVNVPGGGEVIPVEEGAVIVDSTNKPVGLVKGPWAKDANGRDVYTYFKTDGKTLTQYVDHANTEDVAYPVVADPVVFWLMGAVVKCFVGGSLQLRGSRGDVAWVRIAGALWGCVGF